MSKDKTTVPTLSARLEFCAADCTIRFHLVSGCTTPGELLNHGFWYGLASLSTMAPSLSGLSFNRYQTVI